VYDYVHGKADWLAAGLPTEGTNAERPRAGDVARSDVPTCDREEPIEHVRARVRDAGWDACVVVNSERVVFGILRERELTRSEGADGRVEEYMRPGPSTFRPNVSIEQMAAFMTEHDLVSAPITSSDGRLIGLLLRDDAMRVALELQGHVHHEDEDR
jgi:CBS domain-containing protein